jgi:hypothetical protein
MNTTYVYLAVTLAALTFCGVLLVFTHDPGTHDAALVMAGGALGHWFGYSNQLTNSQPVPATQPEAPKTT